jgi:hypothetical protein
MAPLSRGGALTQTRDKPPSRAGKDSAAAEGVLWHAQ